MSRKLFLISIIIFFNSFLYAQKKKDIKKNKIKSIVVTQTENGKTLNDEKIIYNADGEIIEEIQYSKDGK